MAEDSAPDSRIDHASSIEYWEGIDADVNGMLGGFPHVSRIERLTSTFANRARELQVDLQSSKNFLAKLGVAGKKKKMSEDQAGDGGMVGRCVDCGAGIGRITDGLLTSVAYIVDVVEPVAKFSEKLHGRPGIGHIFNVGLENWTPSEKYDLIWNQWCLGHLMDLQLLDYLERCRGALREGGFVVVKENLSPGTSDLFDELDSSVTRTDDKFRELFSKAGFVLVRQELQKGFPKELYPVRTYALKPRDQ